MRWYIHGTTTLRWKLVFVQVVFLDLAALAISFLVYWIQTDIRIYAKERSQVELAVTIASGIQPLLDGNAPLSDVYAFGDEVTAANPDIAVYVLDDLGNTVLPLTAHALGGEGHNRPQIAELERQLADPSEGFYKILDPGRSDYATRAFSVSRLLLNGVPGYLLAVIEGGQFFHRALGVSRENLLITQSVGLFIAIILSAAVVFFLFLSQLSRKFRLLTSAALRFKQGEYSHRIEISRENDELDEIGTALNGMASKLESSVLELKHNENLRRSLLNNVSNDLRAPIENIKRICGALQMGPSENGRKAAPLKSLDSNLSLLEHMLHELRELATLERISLDAELDFVVLQSLFGELHSEFKREASGKNIRLSVFIDDDIPRVLGDEHLLRRLVANLLGNALRYTPAGGEVSLSAARGERGVLVRVSDTGVGISKEELPKLFERYYRGDHSRPVIEGSTGLGLAIVKRLVEIHHTSIFVESKVGVGSSFWFELRAEENPRQKALA